MPETNRRLILKSRPDGIPGPRHFDLDQVDVVEPNPGEALIRNVYQSVDPAHRSIRRGAAGSTRPPIIRSRTESTSISTIPAARSRTRSWV